MRLNTIKPSSGSRRARLRVGRGASAGQGKTCGRGVKGQRARKGGYHKVGFEGGQMPLQRRMPKVGFRSAIKALRAEVRLHELAAVPAAVIDLAALKAAQIVRVFAESAKVVLSGELEKAVHAQGHRRHQGRARGDRGRRRQGRGLMANQPFNNPAATLAEAGRTGEIRSRLLFLLGALVVYRIGTFIPVPGIDPAQVRASSPTSRTRILGVVNSSAAARCRACRSSPWA